ncbi:MAG TPA: GC-type dockerin domain-anchored protein [Phycisphaerales bacterium]|nr:GC-type dockerin domain-anchored protein [Phycisphaerales bacterium]
MKTLHTASSYLCGLAVAAGSSAALGQTTLKNDRFPNDVSTVADAQMSIQAGFVANEQALAILNVPTNLQAAFRVTRIQIMWASTSPGLAPPSDQSSIMIYSGSVLQPGSMLVFDSKNDAAAGDGLTPQMQDGGLNEFDFTGEDIVLHNVAKISVGLEFLTETNQQSGPSVCSDWPPNNANRSTAGANAIYGTWPEMGINTPQFFEPRIDLGPPFGVFGISGNFFIRAVIENASNCPADLGSQGGFQGADGVLDNNDFIVFINYFFGRNAAADVGRTGGLPGADLQWDNNDFVAYIDMFFAGCA